MIFRTGLNLLLKDSSVINHKSIKLYRINIHMKYSYSVYLSYISVLLRLCPLDFRSFKNILKHLVQNIWTTIPWIFFQKDWTLNTSHNSQFLIHESQHWINGWILPWWYLFQINTWTTLLLFLSLQRSYILLNIESRIKIIFICF